MAQTGLEEATLLILFAVIAFVIIVVFGYFLILGFGFASGCWFHNCISSPHNT